MYANDITNIPAPKGGLTLVANLPFIEVNLYTATAVLKGGKTCSTHHPFEHDATGNAGLDVLLGKCLFALLAVLLVQGFGLLFGAKMIRESRAVSTDFIEFFTSFGNELIFTYGLRVMMVGHRSIHKKGPRPQG